MRPGAGERGPDQKRPPRKVRLKEKAPRLVASQTIYRVKFDAGSVNLEDACKLSRESSSSPRPLSWITISTYAKLLI